MAGNPLVVVAGEECVGKKELADVEDWREGMEGEGVSRGAVEVGLKALPEEGKEENDCEGGS